MYLLVPGRHQLLTNYQHHYLSNLLSVPLSKISDINGEPVLSAEPISAIIFAVTSANHSNTRRNPLPFYLRTLGLAGLSASLRVPVFIYGIDDVGNLDHFSRYTLMRIKHESEGMFDLRPENTLVLCSTPVLEMYERDGFRILPAELSDRKTWSHHTLLPWDLVERIAAQKEWSRDPVVLEHMHPASREIWLKYRIGEKVQMLFRDHMIGDDGDITATRDYNVYVRQMDEIAGLKYQETAAYIRPGRIGDIGCAVGSWIKLACEDTRWRESDFYGIEVARPLFEVCQQRKVNGDFTNPFVFFAQRNAVAGLAFDRGSMNTIHTSSLTHEIESYGGRQELLDFIRNRFEELQPGGIWINRDVVGPSGKDKIVLMKVNAADGRNEDWDRDVSKREELAAYLNGLSTRGRFLRFARDFRANEGYRLTYEWITRAGVTYARLTLSDACEFMSRKDYTDNWQSEMHETFCFWDFEEWTTRMKLAGFTVLPESKAYTNPWIVANRLKGKAELFTNTENPEPMDYPVNSMILLGVRN